MTTFANHAFRGSWDIPKRYTRFRSANTCNAAGRLARSIDDAGASVQARVRYGAVPVRRGSSIEVLLVHPSGNYNRRAPWGIPKGAPDPGRDARGHRTARDAGKRPGSRSRGPLVDLGHVDYTRSKKRVHGYAVAAPYGAVPRCASWEVDKVEFIEISRARRVIHPDQAALLDRLSALVLDRLHGPKRTQLPLTVSATGLSRILTAGSFPLDKVSGCGNSASLSFRSSET